MTVNLDFLGDETGISPALSVTDACLGWSIPRPASQEALARRISIMWPNLEAGHARIAGHERIHGATPQKKLWQDIWSRVGELLNEKREVKIWFKGGTGP